MHKLKQTDISGKLFDIIMNFLNFRKQRVLLNGQYSSWATIEARVPQGSVLQPLMFLMTRGNKSPSSNDKLDLEV